nr:DUF1403 family protein [Sedimentitalea todarodis]
MHKATQLASKLTRRTARLNAVAPKLRAKGAGAAVQIFLTQDAVAPAALPLLDRAPLRFCDRLVELSRVAQINGITERALPEMESRRCVQNVGGQVRSSG